MTRQQVVDSIADSIATMEGFYKAGTLPQKNANPGDIRIWKDKMGPYPQSDGYVDFNAWAVTRGQSGEQAGVNEGWRVLKVLVGNYIDGKYTKSDPTFVEMFSVYAPSSDANNPNAYAEYVAKQIGADPNQTISSLITD